MKHPPRCKTANRGITSHVRGLPSHLITELCSHLITEPCSHFYYSLEQLQSLTREQYNGMVWTLMYGAAYDGGGLQTTGTHWRRAFDSSGGSATRSRRRWWLLCMHLYGFNLLLLNAGTDTTLTSDEEGARSTRGATRLSRSLW